MFAGVDVVAGASLGRRAYSAFLAAFSAFFLALSAALFDTSFNPPSLDAPSFVEASLGGSSFGASIAGSGFGVLSDKCGVVFEGIVDDNRDKSRRKGLSCRIRS